MTNTPEQLAALDWAATQGELIDLATLPDQIQSLRNHAEERRGKGWLKSAANLEASAYLIETLAAEVAKYRTGKLVLIDDGAVERVAGGISTCPPMSDKHPMESLPLARATAAEAWVEVLKDRLEQAAHNLEVGAQLYECPGLEEAGKLARQVLKGSNNG